MRMIKNLTLITALVIGLVGCTPSTEESTDTSSDSPVSEDTTVTKESQGVMVGGALMTPDKDIVENAANSEDHTTLVSAVQVAELTETLKGPGPFTVFAPTDDAFEALPGGTVDTLLMPENQEDLTGVLTYHVVPGTLKTADLVDGQILTTVNGQDLTVTNEDGVWMINDAQVTIADAVSSNGVTHIIDKVLLPE